MDSQKEEGPAPLLWRFSDFLKWAELCPSQPEIGHALMRLVITGQEIPHACEVELLILSHHFYKSSACLDGVDILVALAATRVEAYVSEGDFPCLARLITGVGNFHALNFILGILIENGQLDLLLQKYSAAADTNAGTAEAVRGFRMAVLTSLKHFNPKDLDAFAMVYTHFDMKHETASLLESRAWQSSEQWFHRYDKDQNEDLLESMRYFIEAAEVHSSIDAGNKTCRTCAQASLVSLQIRMPDSKWLSLSETNARRLLVEQSRFQEALIVAEAYGLNQPSEWALVLWNQMLKPELTEEFVAEFVAVLPLQPTMLVELARFYRAEVAARGDQSQFSVWLTGGGLPAEWAKYLGRSFRCLLKSRKHRQTDREMASTVVKEAFKAIREKGLGTFLRQLREEGYLKCLADGNLLQTKIHNIGATLVGVDKFGNKYYERLEDMQFGRHRWIEYAEKDRYNASQVPPEWHGWLHFITDHTGDELLMLRPKRYGVEHRENLSGEGEEFIYHSKGHALNPGQKNWTRYQPWQPSKPE